MQRPDMREYDRKTYRLPLQHREFGNGSAAMAISSTDSISQGGVSFRSTAFLPLVRRLVVEIALPAGSDPIRAISRVIWVKKATSADAYEIGIQFLEMKKADRARIASIVN